MQHLKIVISLHEVNFKNYLKLEHATVCSMQHKKTKKDFSFSFICVAVCHVSKSRLADFCVSVRVCESFAAPFIYTVV